MAISLSEKKLSPTGMRLDAQVKVTSFWGGGYDFKLRVLAYKPMDADRIEELAEAVAGKKGEWSKKKQNYILRLPEWEATAFIPINSLNEDDQ